MSLPERFLERISKFPDPNYRKAILDRANNPSVKITFRQNTLKPITQLSDWEDLRARSTAHESNLSFYSIESDNREWLTHHPLTAQGSIYIQNPSSMLAAEILSKYAELQRVLDLTAAPGSKTSYLAARMNNGGYIAAVEIVKKRVYRLKANLKRLGVKNTKVFFQNGEVVGRYRPNHFDSVLLDAPCSSEARMSSMDEESTKYWSLKKISEMQRKQKRLLNSAIQSCQPGGHILYSTCSFAPEENEEVVQDSLDKFGSQLELMDMQLEGIPHVSGFKMWETSRFSDEICRSRRILPNEDFEGFYLALLKKKH